MSKREKRKKHHKEREQQYRSIERKYEEIAYKKRRPDLIELDSPRFGGYELYYDIADEYIGTIYEVRVKAILDKCQHTVIKNTKDFTEKVNGKKRQLLPTFYGNRNIWDFPKETLRMLNIFMVSRMDRDTWSRYLTDRYHITFVNPKFLKLKIRKYYITHIFEDQPEVKRAYDEYIGLMYGEFINYSNFSWRSSTPKWYRKTENRNARRKNKMLLDHALSTDNEDINFIAPKRNWW